MVVGFYSGRLANNNGVTPLHNAVRYGHLDICRLMIEKIVDKNPANNYEWTPLHVTAFNGHLDICRLIIENIDNINPVDNKGRTPKDLADMKLYFNV